MGKHKKSHKDEVPKSEEILKESEDNIGSLHKKNKKKKKKHKKEEDNLEIETVADETKLNETQDKAADLSIQLIKKKKKKKEKEKCEESNEKNIDNSQSMNLNKRKREEEFTENLMDEVPKKKKKKRKHKEEKETGLNHDTVESEEMEINENTKLNKKKKKRKEKCEQENGYDVETKIESEYRLEETEPKKKKKKHKSKKEENSAENDTDERDRVNEIAPTGSILNEHPVRKEPFLESVSAGQWNSASLGDTDRQNKFLRLLGGFKKGSDTNGIKSKFVLGSRTNSNKPVLFSKSGDSERKLKFGGNVAMDKKQEEIYKKSMENEYERAMSMNLNRGVGLGFQKPPEEGKKFYIDTKKSNSIKFDD